MALSGSLAAGAEMQGPGVVFRSRAGAVLRYAGLVARDAHGRVLASRIELGHGDLLIRVDAAGASYPLRIDPLITAEPKLTGPGEIGEGLFGDQMAVSADGKTAVVGAPGDNGEAGAAWVFTRSGGSWSEQGELKAGLGEAPGGRFGSSVAISSNGSAVVVGAPADGGGVGSVWVFTRSAGNWSEQEELAAGEGESGAGAFGTSVAVSADGATAVVGAPADGGGVGSAWVFVHGEKWSEQEELLAGDGESGAGAFGTAVAVSADGATAVVGAPADGGGVGSAWVFVHGEKWGEQEELVAGDGESGAGAFGTAVAVSGDGGTAVVGAPADGGGVGSAWVFAHGEKWGEQEELVAGKSESGKGKVGSAVAMSETGATVLAGAPADSGGLGAAFLFSRSAGNWSEQEEITAGEDRSGNGRFGAGLGLSADGSTAVVGAPGDDGNIGAAWAYGNPPIVTTGAASSLTQTSAVLGASVNPNGAQVEECQLEYGTSASYGSSAACSPSPGSGSSAVAVAGAVSGLSANTTYHFRVAATNAGGTSYGSDVVFKTLPDAPTVTTGTASSVTRSSASLGGSVDPNGAHVEDCVLEYGTSTSYGSSVACSPSPGSGTSAVSVSGAVSSLSAEYDLSLQGHRHECRWDQPWVRCPFRTLPDAPALTTDAASSITQTSASLGGSVDPNGAQVEDCILEYGTSTSYGSSVACSPSPGSGSSAVSVSAAVSSLSANTAYHFRITATNAGGTSHGSDVLFKTLPDAPTVATGAASSVTQATAELAGSVDPNGGQVEQCHLEYGTSTAYGSSIACSPPPGSGTSVVPVAGAVSGLAANTTYHFRVTATNAGGTSYGSDVVFKTLPMARGHDGLGVFGLPDLGLPGRVGESQRRAGRRMRSRIRHFDVVWLERGVLASPGSGSSVVSVAGAVSGLSVNTTYHFRVTATNAGGTSHGADVVFRTLPDAPTVATGAASSVTRTSACLGASVNPNGGQVEECVLEYGTSTSYGSSAACSPSPGSGSSAVLVSGAVSGLSVNTTYHFRVTATNAGGTSHGSDVAFRTLPNAPTVTTGAASSITQTSATLGASVTPNGGQVEDCVLEYGTSTSYSSSIACAPSPGSGSSAVAVSGAVSSLSANTTYHFRVTAINAGGTSHGSDVAFRTLPDAPTVATASASSLTQTSVTLGGSVNPNGGNVEECVLEYGTSTSYGSSVAVLSFAGVWKQCGVGVGRAVSGCPRIRATTSGSRPRTPAARVTGPMWPSGRCRMPRRSRPGRRRRSRSPRRNWPDRLIRTVGSLNSASLNTALRPRMGRAWRARRRRVPGRARCRFRARCPG